MGTSVAGGRRTPRISAADHADQEFALRARGAPRPWKRPKTGFALARPLRCVV